MSQITIPMHSSTTTKCGREVFYGFGTVWGSEQHIKLTWPIDKAGKILWVFNDPDFQEPATFISASTHGIPLEIINIVNKHLRGDRDVLLCQDELIDAGYIDWARL